MANIENKLTGESWDIHNDDFRIEAAEFTLTRENARLEGLHPRAPEAVDATYRADGHTLKVIYKLLQKNHFLEKQLILTSPYAFGLKKVVVGQYAFAGPKLKLIRYGWLKNAVYFGRAEKGGIFLGVEMPFDSSSLDSNGMVTLGYAPSLRVAANEPLVCEPIYFGVYAKEPNDAELPHLAMDEAQMREQSYNAEFGGKAPSHFPLRSESAAMIAMTSAILGPRPERLAPFMDGWESEMTRAAYETREDVHGEVRSIDFAAECGMAYVAGGSIWGGAVLQVNALRDDDRLQLGEFALDVAAHARKKGIGWQLWHSLTSTNPWDDNRIPQDGNRPYPPSHPYCPDQPDWQVSPTPAGVKAANCFGHQAFFEWLYKRIIEAVDDGKFSRWMADGDFLGGGGTVKPSIAMLPTTVTCPATRIMPVSGMYSRWRAGSGRNTRTSTFSGKDLPWTWASG
jgi:hypothetical protein